MWVRLDGVSECGCGVMDGVCVGGSVVECSPATRAARVRFPADA